MSMRWISAEELDAQPELIRTKSVQPPRDGGTVRLVEFEDVDLQPCRWYACKIHRQKLVPSE